MLVITRNGVTTQIISYATGATTLLTAIMPIVCFLFGARNHIASTVRNTLDSLISNLFTLLFHPLARSCIVELASHMYMFWFSVQWILRGIWSTSSRNKQQEVPISSAICKDGYVFEKQNTTFGDTVPRLGLGHASCSIHLIHTILHSNLFVIISFHLYFWPSG